MSKLHIPSLETLLVLTKPWKFKLYFESRNISLLEKFLPTLQHRYYYDLSPDDFTDKIIPDLIEFEEPMSEEELSRSYRSYRATNNRENPFIHVTFPVGTKMIVDRIYIRRGSESFNSVTFKIPKAKAKADRTPYDSSRFWVKLKDANNIEADIF
jgi:hypothetical protein